MRCAICRNTVIEDYTKELRIILRDYARFYAEYYNLTGYKTLGEESIVLKFRCVYYGECNGKQSQMSYALKTEDNICKLISYLNKNEKYEELETILKQLNGIYPRFCDFFEAKMCE